MSEVRDDQMKKWLQLQRDLGTIMLEGHIDMTETNMALKSYIVSQLECRAKLAWERIEGADRLILRAETLPEECLPAHEAAMKLAAAGQLPEEPDRFRKVLGEEAGDIWLDDSRFFFHSDKFCSYAACFHGFVSRLTLPHRPEYDGPSQAKLRQLEEHAKAVMMPAYKLHQYADKLLLSRKAA